MKSLIQADTKKLKKEFLDFYIDQYRNHPLKRDSMSGLLKGILFESSELSKAVKAHPVMVMDDDKIVLVAVLAHVDRMADYLQIAFFESPEYDMEAFSFLMEESLILARKYGSSKISASLNIHVNYGLGYLYEGYEKPQSFGMAHNKPHIHTYFEEYDFMRIEMVTFKKDMDSLETLLPSTLKKRVRSKYSVRPVDFSKLKEESATYTRINNDSFKDHLFYYRRVQEEDLELFKDFRFLLKPENLLFVQRDGRDVGFMLWYPDFHQVMSEKRSIGAGTVLSYKLNPYKIDTFKIVEMGVVKEEQGKGAILALFDYCQGITKGRYRYFESGWVLKENLRSRSFGDKWSDGVSKTFAAYVKELV
ncbi:hypothetical protein [Gudongella sp. DL1XJH-153]|uniref:hypothetical protein n=1 Tax=Gudongella sp. DL1XJH-153 TaxID=3409804 RepID=UPI003BB5BFE8